MDEILITSAMNMRCWEKPKMGWTKFGTTLGHIVVTNKRFLFLSSGKMEFFGRGNIHIGPHTFMLPMDDVDINNLDLSELGNIGSLDIPLTQVKQCMVGRMLGVNSYLTVRGTNKGYDFCVTFAKDPYATNRARLKKIVAAVKHGKERLLQNS